MRPPGERIKVLEMARGFIERDRYICHALDRVWHENNVRDLGQGPDLEQAISEVRDEIRRGLDGYTNLQAYITDRVLKDCKMVDWPEPYKTDFHFNRGVMQMARLAWIDRLIKFEQDLIKSTAKPDNGDWLHGLVDL